MGWRGEKDVHLPLYVCHCLLGVVAQCNTSTRGGGEGRTKEAQDKASRESNLNLPTRQVPHQSKLAMCYF